MTGRRAFDIWEEQSPSWPPKSAGFEWFEPTLATRERTHMSHGIGSSWAFATSSAETRGARRRGRYAASVAHLARVSFELRKIADTSQAFTDFSPYVATVGADGAVSFQAAVEGNRTGVYVGDGEILGTVVESGPDGLRAVVSHPAVADDGTTFYGHDSNGDAVYLARGDRVERIAGAGEAALRAIGPLGPTMSRAGVAFRATHADGSTGVYLGSSGGFSAIADTRGELSMFHGLPVVTPDGKVFFRADLRNGEQAIFRHFEGRTKAIVDTRSGLSGLGRFPSTTHDGTVVLAASISASGSGSTREERAVPSGIFAVKDGPPIPLITSGDSFESLRGALTSGGGAVVFMGTPRAGRLALFSGPNVHDDRILGIGDTLCGSTVEEFALNPVSMNDACQLAIRVKLANGLQLVLRADPRA